MIIIGLCLISSWIIVNSSDYADKASIKINVIIQNLDKTIMKEFEMRVHPFDTVATLHDNASQKSHMNLEEYSIHLFPDLEQELSPSAQLDQLLPAQCTKNPSKKMAGSKKSSGFDKQQHQQQQVFEPQFYFIYRESLPLARILNESPLNEDHVSYSVSPLTSMARSQIITDDKLGIIDKSVNFGDAAEVDNNSEDIAFSRAPSGMERAPTHPQPVRLSSIARVQSFSTKTRNSRESSPIPGSSVASGTHLSTPRSSMQTNDKSSIDALTLRMDQMEKRMSQFEQITHRILQELSTMRQAINVISTK